MYRDEDLDDDAPTLAERVIARYPAHNWRVINKHMLRLDVGDAHIEVAAYSYETEGEGEGGSDEIRCDLEVSRPRGGDSTMEDVTLDDLPEAIGQGLAALMAADVAQTGESENVDAEDIPEWAVASFAKQAAMVADRLTETAYLKTRDPDDYALRHVVAYREKWVTSRKGADDSEPDHALAEAAAWLLSPTKPGDTLPPSTPGWVATLKAQITEHWPDPEGAHEVLCIKAAGLLLAEIARCRRVRQKAEQSERAAQAATTEEKAKP